VILTIRAFNYRPAQMKHTQKLQCSDPDTQHSQVNSSKKHNKWSKNFLWKAAWPSCHPSPRRMDSSDFDPVYYMVPWAHRNRIPKRHLDRFTRFCTAPPECPTHRHTDHATCYICHNRSHL